MIAPLLAVALAGAAWAGEPEDKARAAALLDEGNKLFAARRYEAARDRYQSAYAAYASPKILLNLAEAHRELGAIVDAVECYERFLRDAKGGGDPKHRALAEKRRGELAQQLGLIELRGPAGAEVSVDGAAVGVLPLEPVRVLAGRHSVTARGFDDHVLVRAGRTEVVTLQAPSAPPVVVAASAPPPEVPEAQLASTPEIPASPPPSAPLVASAAPAPAGDDDRLVTSWWFWAGVGALAASAVVVGVAASSGGDEFVPGGDLGRVSTANWQTFTPGGGP